MKKIIALLDEFDDYLTSENPDDEEYKIIRNEIAEKICSVFIQYLKPSKEGDYYIISATKRSLFIPNIIEHYKYLRTPKPEREEI